MEQSLHPFERHPDRAAFFPGEGVLDGVRHEFVYNETERNRAIGRQRLALNIGLEGD